MIQNIKILKFGSLSIEFGESPYSQLMTLSKNMGKLGDSSITLIKYKGDFYLIDTGFANEGDLSQQNLKFNELSLKYLFDLNDISFNDIKGIFITHWHGDHFGNLRLFSNAKLYSYLPKKYEKTDLDSKLINSSQKHCIDISLIAKYYRFEHLLPLLTLNENDKFAGSEIFPTPGHTALHCSILIKYKEFNIVHAGDAIVSQSYFDHDTSWSYNSGNLGEKKCKESMDKIIEIADYIIPGHGHPFQNYKRNVKI
ncbi:MAG: MBL fold metallo-hydrolase [Candidatus Helarchaeota archaeon]